MRDAQTLFDQVVAFCGFEVREKISANYWGRPERTKRGLHRGHPSARFPSGSRIVRTNVFTKATILESSVALCLSWSGT